MPGWAKTLMVGAVTVFFAVMWGLHIRAQFAGTPVGSETMDYSRLLGPDTDEVHRTYDIYLVGSRLGDTETTVVRQEDGTITVENVTKMEAGSGLQGVLGVSAGVNIEFTARVKPLSGVQHFSLVSDELGVMLNGRRGDEGFLVTGRLRGERVNMTVPVNQRQFIGGLLSPMQGMPELGTEAVGKSWKIPLVNPVRGTVQQVQVEVQDRRSVRVNSTRWVIYRLRLSAGGNAWHSWVREDGELLIQGTPFGLTLRQENLPDAVLNAATSEE